MTTYSPELVQKEALDVRLERIEASFPIDPNTVDYDFVNPVEALASEFGQIFHYFGRVENEVALNVCQIETLLHHVDPTTRRFLNIWEAQEVPHGQIFDKAQEQLGLEPFTVTDFDPSAKFKVGGELSRIPMLRDVLLMMYLGRGAMHERMTSEGYGLLRAKLEQVGEHAFVETGIKPIIKQEAGHLGYYKLAANQVKARLSPRQLRMARFINEHTYTPVGASSDTQKREFAGVVQSLTGNKVEAFTRPVREVAKTLFDTDDEAEFVTHSLTSHLTLEI